MCAAPQMLVLKILNPKSKPLNPKPLPRLQHMGVGWHRQLSEASLMDLRFRRCLREVRETERERNSENIVCAGGFMCCGSALCGYGEGSRAVLWHIFAAESWHLG